MFKTSLRVLRPLAQQSTLTARSQAPFLAARCLSTSARRPVDIGNNSGSLNVLSGSQGTAQVPNKDDLYPVTQPPLDTYPAEATRNNSNGSDQDVIERMKIREICEGWGLYRDAGEWQNYRSMFHDDAYIATSWNQGPIDEFIEASKAGFEKGSSFMYIMHRIIGQTVDVQGDRAVSKMKVTITCRFTFDGIEVDNEADCRFFFMLEKRGGKWGICRYTLLFDKDKMVPVHPSRSFDIPMKEVEKYPSYVQCAKAACRCCS